MAVETTRWCDRCLRLKDQRVVGEAFEVTINKESRSQDLCQACVDVLFAEWRDLVGELGTRSAVAPPRVQPRPPAVERRRPAPGTVPYTPVPCPACDRRIATAQALQQHLKSAHDFTLPPSTKITKWRYGNRCPLCAEDAGPDEGQRVALSRHAMRKHAEIKGLQGLWDAAEAAGDPHRVIEQRNASLRGVMKRQLDLKQSPLRQVS